MTGHNWCDYKCKVNSTVCNSNQKWNNKTCQCEYKNYCTCKKDHSWNPGTCNCENSKYLKITSVTECDGIISYGYCINKKDKCYQYYFNKLSLYISKRFLYFVHSFISNHITIDNNCFLLSSFKTKRYDIKWKIMNFKKFALKIVSVIILTIELN